MPNISRRTFLWLTGGSSIALASNPQRKLVNRLIPLVTPVENLPSGEWALFATTCRECPAGCGMHLWHRDGRVTKAEGNPSHPVNRGGLCPRGQSSVQGLYDPDRVKGVVHRPRGGKGQAASWDAALAAVAAKLKGGGRVAVVSSLQTGALAEVMESFAAAFPPQRLLLYEPLNYGALTEGHRQALGLPVVPQYRLDRCDFVLSFAADFLESWVSPVSFASQFGEMRAWGREKTPGRLAYVGPRLSMTAANADLFLQVAPGGERLVALAVLREIVASGRGKRDLSRLAPLLDRVVPPSGAVAGVPRETVQRLARWFNEGSGSVALAGPAGSFAPYAEQTAAAAALINYAAGRLGETVDFSRPHAVGGAAGTAELQRFLGSLDGRDVLFVHDTNLLYAAPQAVRQLERAGLVVYLGTMPDETAQRAEWVLPIDSPLESWGEYEPVAGVHSLMQPVMGRTTESRHAGDIFLQVARGAGRPLSRRGAPADAGFQGWLAARWEELHKREAPGSPFEEFWEGALRAGGYWGKPPAPARVAVPSAPPLFTEPPSPGLDDTQVLLWPWASIMLFDGRVSNRSWLQEAPDPVTFISWGNWIDLHPKRAAALKLATGDVAELSNSMGAVRAPVRVTDEVPEGVAALSYGQGHRGFGRNADGIGANVFALLATPEPAPLVPVCRLRKVGEPVPYDPTFTSPSRHQFERKLLQWAPLSELAQRRDAGEELDWPLPEGYRRERDLYPKREYLSHRWGMAVDLQRCVGCGACAVACYAENNVATMGKEQVARQLEMAWLRVPPYRKEGGSPGLGWLPMLCQQCDSAPCEPVCPVYAAVHNEEGLNAQVYNRCIGTRYCNNNCPYKVRRFNWLNVEWPKPLDLQLNPEVTVRTRGVMEKCTFCIQRIRGAEYRALREGRPVRDGEITPACAQSCPARVYTFGDLLDPLSKVSKLVRSDPRRYQVLHELNTKPAVIYLRRVENDLA